MKQSRLSSIGTCLSKIQGMHGLGTLEGYELIFQPPESIIQWVYGVSTHTTIFGGIRGQLWPGCKRAPGFISYLQRESHA